MPRFAVAGLAALAAVVGPLAALAADVPPPQFLDDSINVKGTVTADPLRVANFGRFKAKFEETTLAQIRERLGAASLMHQGDAAESMYWLCYSMPDQIIWLASNGEMGGEDHALTNIFAEKVDALDPRLGSCPLISPKLRPPSLVFGWLGSSRTAVEKTLGPPSGSRGDWLLFLYERNVAAPHRGPTETKSHIANYDVIAYIELKIQDERVVALRVSHVTSD